MIRNPTYKGKWTAPYIDNPAYKGPWKPRKIRNPGYFEDKTPSNLEPIGAIGFELWTMQKDILIDNIFIGHSVADANRFAHETFHEKNPHEKLQELAEKSKEDSSKSSSSSNLNFMKDPMNFVKEKLSLFLTIAQNDPIQAIKFVPEVAGGLAALLVTFIVIVISLFWLGDSGSPKKTESTGSKRQGQDLKRKDTDTTSEAAKGDDDAKIATNLTTQDK